MRLSIKLFLIFLFTFACLTAHQKAYSQIFINTPTTYTESTTISQNLIVNDTLIVQGDLTLQNDVVLTINTGGVVIIYEDLHTSNKITLNIDSYLFVLGSITHTGASKHAEASISDSSQVYIFGDVSTDFDGTDLACPDVVDYQQGTVGDCGHGNLEDFIRNLDDIPEEITDLFGCQASSMPFYYNNGEPHSNSPIVPGGSIFLTANAGASYPASIAYYSWEGPEGFYYSSSSTQGATVTNNAGIEHSGYYIYTAVTTTGCFLRDSTYVLVSDCGFSSGYYSRDNYAGNWREESTWGAYDNSMVLPPPNNPNNSQNITVKGYVTLNDNLSLTGSQQYVCDTLVITGDLYMTINSLTVAPGGVLIVLGDFTAGSGSLVNNEGGKIVFAGEFSKTYSYSFSGTGDTYVFDPYPVSEGFTPTGDQDYLEANDPSLYNFYISLVGGTPPSADCKKATIYLDASGQASIQPIHVHDGSLHANLTYSLSQSDFDCSHLGANTITLTATNGGGASDECTAVVTVVDDIAPIITNCPDDEFASCVENIPPPKTTYEDFVLIGGVVSDNCTNGPNLVITSVDVTDKIDAINPCEVVRTYTITDEAGNAQTCTQTFTITDATAPAIEDCPADISDFADVNCEKVISVTAPTNFTDGCGFGDVTVYHAYTIADSLVEVPGDIVEVAFPKGTTIVTWSFEDECGNIGTCEQAITIEDNTAPTASCPASQELDAENACSALLPDYTNLLTGLTDNCDSNPTVTQRPAENTEVFTNTEVWLIYADEDGNQDSCSFMVNLTNLAPLDISEMTYDDNQSGVGAIGSGQKPFITSIHPYEIDQDETAPEDYTYTWLVLDQLGTEVTPDISYPDDNPRNAVIAFSETHFTEGDFYTIRVIKEQLTGNCSAVFELDIEVQETDFNSGVEPLGPTCQDGGTGLPTVVFWDVDFTGGVEPYAFAFTISNGSGGCTGEVSNLFTNDLESIAGTENCDGTYAVAVTKESGAPAVQIAFTFVSEAGVDKDFNLTIQSATDQFSITKQTINTDESDNIILWGVPNTSDIETD